MSVKIDGIEKLEVNYYEQISISENSVDDIDISVVGGISYANSNRFYDEIKNMDERGKMLAVVQRYLDTFKINRVTNIGKLSNSLLYRLSVAGCCGEKKLNLDLSKPKYRVIYKMAMNKYLQDRYDFCFSEDIKKVRISFSSIESKYDRCVNDCLECKYNNRCYKDNSADCDPYISLTLKTNKDGKIADFEKVFIKDYLYYMFGKYDEKIRINHIYRETPYVGNPIISEYILECGDIKVVIPYDSSMMIIFNIVDEYNKELMKVRIENENVLKRQLKLEEF